MRIVCTVKEFGQLVRGCVKSDCNKCPLYLVCKASAGSESCKSKGVEQFIRADDLINETLPKRKPDFLKKGSVIETGGYQPTEAPERLIPPVGSGGEDG